MYFLDKKYTIDEIYEKLDDEYNLKDFINLVMYNGSKIVINKFLITAVYEVDEKSLMDSDCKYNRTCNRQVNRQVQKEAQKQNKTTNIISIDELENLDKCLNSCINEGIVINHKK